MPELQRHFASGHFRYAPSVSVDAHDPRKGFFFLRLASCVLRLVGVNTGFDMSQTNEIFGWTHFRNAETGLGLLGSGVSYDDPGNIIGTTKVPEPSSLAIATIFAAAIVTGRRSRFQPNFNCSIA